MKEIIVTGKNLDAIREEWADKWECTPDKLILEIIEKHGVLNKTFKVRVALPLDEENQDTSGYTTVTCDGEKYLVHPGAQVETVIPFPKAGRLLYKDQEIIEEVTIDSGDILVFHPAEQVGSLTWSIELQSDRCKAVAKVKREYPGRYILPDIIPNSKKLVFESHVGWEQNSKSNESEDLTEDIIRQELSGKRVTYGIKPDLLSEFSKINGEGEVLLAEATYPVPPVPTEIIDYVGEPVKQEENEFETIDFFASKLKVCSKDEVLAKKIPGKEGIPGKDIFGEILPAQPFKDPQFKLQKNVYLSEDGLKVKAACDGTPIRVDDLTYLVENLHIVSGDVDLETGSIDFPGDVAIGGNVSDGLWVNADGKIKVKGSVTNAQLKGEAGASVETSIIASKIFIGEKHANRSRFSKLIQEVNEDLITCVTQVEQLQSVSKDTKIGPLLKVVLEKKYPQLSGKTEELEKMLIPADPEFISKEVEVAVRTLRHFLVGLGPLQLEDLRYIKNAVKVIESFTNTKGNMLPSNVMCETNYIQNSEIVCAGDFICRKGAYNSSIKAGGNIKIFGVYRGGDINCNGNIYILELGGPSISSTIVGMSKTSRLNVDYCHGNVKIYIGRELVSIDEDVQKLEVYRENGIVQVEKIKWDGHK